MEDSPFESGPGKRKARAPAAAADTDARTADQPPGDDITGVEAPGATAPIASPPAAAEAAGTGRTMVDILALPEGERKVVQWLLRRGEAGVADLAAHTGQAEPELQVLLDGLDGQGFLEHAEVDGETRWRARLATRPARPARSDLWKALEE